MYRLYSQRRCHNNSCSLDSCETCIQYKEHILQQMMYIALKQKNEKLQHVVEHAIKMTVKNMQTSLY